MTRKLTPLEIEYIVSAVGDFRIKASRDDEYTLEELRSRLRKDLSTELVKEGVVGKIRERVSEKFKQSLVKPLTPSVINAGSSIMAPIVQSVLNSHKNAGGSTDAKYAHEMLIGTQVRSDEHTHFRLKGCDFDREAYDKYAQELLRSGSFNYALLGFKQLSYVDTIPFLDKLEKYDITFPGIKTTLSIGSIYYANLTPPMILDDLRLRLQDIVVVGLHTSMENFDLYFFSTTYTYIELITKVRDALSVSGSDNKFTHYTVLNLPLSSGIVDHYQEDLGALVKGVNVYYLSLCLGSVDIAADTYIDYVSREANIYGLIYDMAGTLVGIRYTSDKMLDLSSAECYRLNMYGVTTEFYRPDSRVDISHSYSNNIYVLSRMLGIACLIPHFAKEWYEHRLTQNIIMYICAYMFIGLQINSIKHSSLSTMGPLYAMGENAKFNMVKYAMESNRYPIVGPQASVVVGAPLKTSGLTAVKIAQ